MKQATLNTLTISYQDQLEYDTLVEEIFKKRTYYADLDTNTPRIIDAGAHIGMTTLYLSTLYPRAHFICIEPHPQNLALLRQNLETNHVQSYEIIPKALVGTHDPTVVSLYSNNKLTVLSSVQRGGWTGAEMGEAIKVDTMTLSPLLQEPVDLLKMDIEGKETVVIQEAQAGLRTVRQIILEFHKTKNHPEDKVVKILKNFFPQVEITQDERKERNRQNQLLLIEAWRDHG